MPPECARRGSSAARPPELGGAGTGVVALFRFVGSYGVAADRGVDAAAEAVAEGVLDAGVFAAVEADDRGDAAGPEDLGQDGQEAFEVGHLAVDEDAQGLERAGGGVQLGAG